VEHRKPNLRALTARGSADAHGAHSSAATAEVVHIVAGPSDGELVQRIMARDRWAEEAFYRRHVDLVAGTALGLLRNRTEAEDVVQETFLLAFARIAQLRDPQATRAWLMRIAVSLVHRRFRWNSLKRLAFVKPIDDDGALADRVSDDPSGEVRAEFALLDKALQSAKRQDREAWLLRHAVGCSHEEIASACGCSVAAVKRRINNADERIAEHARGEVSHD
jgi:RNA polymerase sigma factor (sigma-70 family)